MDRAVVVTCFLRNRGDVLLLHRGDDVETYPGMWGAVTGYVEQDDPETTARAEIEEETGLTDVSLVRGGEPVAVSDRTLDREWAVNPFLFDAPDRAVELNEESAGSAWVPPTEILRRETVPDLWTAYDRVRPTVESIRQDDEHGSAKLSVRALEVLRDVAGVAAVGGRDQDDVAAVARELVDARPSMAVVRNRVDRAMADASTPREVEVGAIDGIERAFAADAAAAAEAADAIDGTVLTLSRSGTVLEALLAAAPAVIVAESRPAREGVGVAERLADAGLAVTLCTDAAIAHVLSERDVDAVVVGADTVFPDGGIVNKTGTRVAALAADREGVPFYAVAASDKVATEAAVRLESGDPNAVYDGEAAVTAVNPTFDVTPADLVDGVFTERGQLDAHEIVGVADEHRRRADWREQE